ncbi:MAG: hypothetical protein OXU74_06595 [Gemmatimonadota bacterium]|nr:hypothetical protein [Gemmatimonadota bacterium]
MEVSELLAVEHVPRNDQGEAVAMEYGDLNRGPAARIVKAQGDWLIDLHEGNGRKVRRFVRRRGLLRLREMAARWATNQRRLCLVTVFVDGDEAGRFTALEGSDAAHDVEALLPGWRVGCPVWIVPHDDREAAHFPRNVVTVRVSGPQVAPDAPGSLSHMA